MFASEPVLAPKKTPFTTDSTRGRHHIAAFLLLLVVASIGVRVAAWGWWHTGAIESEGAEYASIAENLRNGAGYVGISMPGTELMFPPLYPLLIAAGSYLTKDYELAGRLVSLLLSALLPLPVFAVAFRLFHWRTAAIAAVITIFHPLFINLSISVFSEGPYATLLLTGVYLALRAFDSPSITRWLVAGAAFGIAFLVRQEALAPLIVAVLIGLIAADAPRVLKVKGALAALGVFVLLASPQVLILYRSTGKLRMEGKSAVNYVWGIRTLMDQRDSGKGLPFEESVNKVGYSIDDNFEGTGICMLPNAAIVKEARVRMSDLIWFVREAMRRNIPTLFGHFREKWFGAPFLTAFALLGFFRRPWRRKTAAGHIFFLLIPAIAVVTTFTVVHAVYARNFFILLPFFVIWGANGLFEIARWTNASLAAIFRWTSPTLPGVLVAGLLALAMLGFTFQGTRNLFLFKEGSPESRPLKDAGLWIWQQQTERVTVMDLTTPVAFHAKANYVHFPYASADSALRFMDKAKVDYVVLRREAEFTKYYKDWLTVGIPDVRAQMVYATPSDDPHGVVVFRWQGPRTVVTP